jgi:hypothetical protein
MLDVLSGFFEWIDQIEMKHIAYVAITSVSLFVVGFIGKFYIAGLLSASGDILFIIDVLHNVIIWSGVSFLILSIIMIFILMEVS